MQSPSSPPPRPFEERLLGQLVRLQSFAEKRLGAIHADDLVQETLLRAWLGRSGFDASRDLWPWLKTVAENVAVRRLEVEARQPGLSPEGVAEQSESPGSAKDREPPFDVQPFIAQLSPADQEVVERFYFAGASIREIARDRGCPEGTVKSQLSRARRRLAALLGGLVLTVVALMTPRAAHSPTEDVTTDSPARLSHYSISVEHTRPAPPELRRVDRSSSTKLGWNVVGAISTPIDPSPTYAPSPLHRP